MFTDNKKSCKEIADLLDAYYDQELQLVDTKLVKEHLTNCSNCTQQLQSIAYLVNKIKNLPALKSNTDLISTLDFNKLAPKETKLFKPGILNTNAWLILAATAVVALLFVPANFLSTNKIHQAKLKNHQGPCLADNNKQQYQILKTSLAYLSKLSISKNIATAGARQKLSPEFLLLSDNNKENFTITRFSKEQSKNNTLIENTSNNNDPGYIEIAALGDSNEGTSAGALDIATDEDGLYDIRI